MGLGYTHFDSLGDFLHTNYEKTNFHEFITIYILIKYTEIESDVESNTNKEGDTLLWFLEEKVPVTSRDLKAKLEVSLASRYDISGYHIQKCQFCMEKSLQNQ